MATPLVTLFTHLADQSDEFILHQIRGQNIWLKCFTMGFFRLVFAISINRRQNESFLWAEILLFHRELRCCFFLIL